MVHLLKEVHRASATEIALAVRAAGVVTRSGWLFLPCGCEVFHFQRIVAIKSRVDIEIRNCAWTFLTDIEDLPTDSIPYSLTSSWRFEPYGAKRNWSAHAQYIAAFLFAQSEEVPRPVGLVGVLFVSSSNHVASRLFGIEPQKHSIALEVFPRWHTGLRLSCQRFALDRLPGHPCLYCRGSSLTSEGQSAGKSSTEGSSAFS